MRKLDRLIARYEEFHQDETNRLVHFICVPLIALSLVGLLWCIKIPTTLGDELSFTLNAGAVFIGLASVYYLFLSLGSLLGMLYFGLAASVLCISIEASPLPLFAGDMDGEIHDEPAAHLPEMTLGEAVTQDYVALQLSLKAHPMAFLRASLNDRGFVRACDLREKKFRSVVHVAGVVLIRQRPGSAKGVCFITLEDETGVINLVIWPDLKERQRRVVMGARLMEVRGRVEYDDEVIHVIAQHMTDATADLHKLSDDMLNAPLARADHVASPLPDKFNPRDNLREGNEDPYQPVEPWQEPAPGNRECGWHQGHPRDVRIIPKSRDFH